MYLVYLILIPLVGLLLSLLPDNKHEKALFGISIGAIGLHLAGLVVLTIVWWREGFLPLFYQTAPLYHANEADFSIDLYFDRYTAVFAITAAIISVMVAVFSRYYMHREQGFKRFYNNTLLFYTGLQVILAAGNFETLFVGWEMIGVASFFLIAFYRDRYLPVRNALKVVSLYRLADIALLLAIWLCHHAFGHSVHFQHLYEMEADHLVTIEQPSFQLVIPALFLLVSLIKSAQLPFSSWLPRAMEGPTTSSAIFYGSLSVHMGVFLLIRTYPLWEMNALFTGLVIVLGLATSVVAKNIARVQASIKTQIAYASIGQIGLMFVEVALGWHVLALVHFVGNAFLRTYQLLVSPSVLNYLIHDQFFNFIPPQHDDSQTLWNRLRLGFYILAVKEWNLDTFQYRFLWSPLKRVGHWFDFLTPKLIAWVFVPLYLVGLYGVYHRAYIPDEMSHYLPIFFALLGIIMALKAFVSRDDARMAWGMIVLNQLYTSVAVAYNEQFDFEQVHLFLSGVFIAAGVGFWCLQRLHRARASLLLNQFQGHSYTFPRLTALFMVACLALSGFPITPTFIGEDLMMGHIHTNQYGLTLLMSLALILDGLAVFRIYGRIFLGPHLRGYHEVAYRSS